MLDLQISGDQLTTTPEPPFYTALGWKPAGDLTVGTPIWTASGRWGRIEAVTVRHDPQPMYNLTVATAHTFFVGDGQWLVHNSCWKPDLSSIDSDLRRIAEQYHPTSGNCRLCAEDMARKIKDLDYDVSIAHIEYAPQVA